MSQYIRTKVGVPELRDFASTEGTPLVIDKTTGVLYYLDSNVVCPLATVLPKALGEGIKVDTVSPTFSWRDLEGPIQPKASGVGSPTWKTWSGNIKEWAFVANDVVDVKFHWPHDWAGTDVYIHIHWSHNGTAISGTFSSNIRYRWGKGHGQQLYDAEKTINITQSTPNIATCPALTTFITEVQLSSLTPNGSQINTLQLEPDGLLKTSLIVSSMPSIEGGSFFIEYVDIHYQSSNIGTKQKSPDFYE